MTKPKASLVWATKASVHQSRTNISLEIFGSLLHPGVIEGSAIDESLSEEEEGMDKEWAELEGAYGEKTRQYVSTFELEALQQHADVHIRPRTVRKPSQTSVELRQGLKGEPLLTTVRHAKDGREIQICDSILYEIAEQFTFLVTHRSEGPNPSKAPYPHLSNQTLLKSFHRLPAPFCPPLSISVGLGEAALYALFRFVRGSTKVSS